MKHCFPVILRIISASVVLAFPIAPSSAFAEHSFSPSSSADIFWITESSALFRVNGSSQYDLEPLGYNDVDGEERIYGSFDLGMMKNNRRGAALGGSVFLAVTPNTWRVGARFRWRKWMGKNQYFEIAPGIIALAGDSKSKMLLPGISSSVSYGVSNWLAFSAQVDIIQHEFNQTFPNIALGERWTETSFYGGARLSGAPGLGAGLTAGLVALAAAIAFSPY